MIASIIFMTTLAQASGPAANTEAKTRAKALLGEGTRLYDSGEFAPALEKFTRAYAEYASPKLLYNIAQTERALGRFAEAMESFERFLVQPPEDAAEMTSDAHAAMAELQAKLGRLRIECAKPRVEISLDGKLVGLSPLPDLLWAEPGRHQITARHADLIPVVEDVEVNVGSVRKVMLLLQPLDPATTAVAQRGPQKANAAPEVTAKPEETLQAESSLPDSDGASGGWWLGRKWTWVAAGSTVALVAAATAVSVAMQSKFDSLNQSCGSGSATYNQGGGCSDSQIGTVTDLKNTANVLWALSGAAAVTTGILFFVEGKRVDVAPIAAGGPGLTARMTY